MIPIDLTGKTGVVFGTGNKRSLAWAIAEVLGRAGMRLLLTYQNERLRENVEKLARELPSAFTVECDVMNEGQVAGVFGLASHEFGGLDALVHSIAFARKKDLEGTFRDTTRDGFQTALTVSAWSLLPLAHHAATLMEGRGGSILTLTYFASQRAMPFYNVMGTAKAALEQEVRQLAFELGPKGVRVNAISAGPVSTVAARGIPEFITMKHHHAERSPLGRNITPEEVGKAALFLMSDLASGVTGQILFVDGGYNIMGW